MFGANVGNVGPALLLNVEGQVADGLLQADHVAFLVVGGPVAVDEAPANVAEGGTGTRTGVRIRTEVRNLFDGHTSVAPGS